MLRQNANNVTHTLIHELSAFAVAAAKSHLGFLNNASSALRS